MNECVSIPLIQADAAKEPAPRELTDIDIDRLLPVPLRIQRFIDRIGDPYHFTVNGTDVRIGFTGGQALHSCLANSLSRMTG